MKIFSQINPPFAISFATLGSTFKDGLRCHVYLFFSRDLVGLSEVCLLLEPGFRPIVLLFSLADLCLSLVPCFWVSDYDGKKKTVFYSLARFQYN